MNLPIAAPAKRRPTHPLEPLTAAEVAAAVHILKDAGKVTPTTRFVSVSLKEPPKEARPRLDRRDSRRRARRSPSCSTTPPTPATRRRVSLTDSEAARLASTSPACSRR